MYKGQVKNFPAEVVEWMVKQQTAQGNPADVSVFEKCKEAGRVDGGFNWKKTGEGCNFCYNVISEKDFRLFFERYPKQLKFDLKDILYKDDKSILFSRALTDNERSRITHETQELITIGKKVYYILDGSLHANVVDYFVYDSKGLRAGFGNYGDVFILTVPIDQIYLDKNEAVKYL